MIKNWCKDTHILLKSLYLVFGRYYLYRSLFHSAIFHFHAYFIQLMFSAEKPSMPLSRRGRKPILIAPITGNVFSIQYSVFFAVVTTLCIDSILYIYIIYKITTYNL